MKSKYKKVELASIQDFEDFVKQHKKIKYLDVILGDLSGIIRGKRIPISDADKIFKSGVQFCYSTFLLDTSGYCPDAEGRGFTDGDPDANYYPVKNTLSIIPWHKDNVAQVLITIQDDSRYSSIVDPRNVLAKVWENFSKLKLYPRVAFELEFYLIKRRNKLDENPIPPISKRNKRQAEGTQVYGMSELDDFYDFLEEINKFCKIQNIPASTASSEFAPGQFEINLNSTTDLLKAADDSVLLRRLVKETAIKHGYEATFLSKPYLGEAGSGMHLHLSLYDNNKKNVFAKNKLKNKNLLHAIGGLQKTMYECMAIFAPNINSYRRFLPDQFVPVNSSWGPNNRSVAFRIPVSNEEGARIEHRVAGAEANAYLVLSSILSGIMHGFKNKITPDKPRIDNACDNPDKAMPLNINDALTKLENSKVMNKYLTKEYVKIYVDLKRKEQESFHSEISNTELKWYLNL
jgi:glutamine synthetase